MAALYVLGLTVRDVSRALLVLGTPLGKSCVQGVVAAVERERIAMHAAKGVRSDGGRSIGPDAMGCDGNASVDPSAPAPISGDWLVGALSRLGAERGRRGVVRMGGGQPDVVIDPLLGRVGLIAKGPAGRLGLSDTDAGRGGAQRSRDDGCAAHFLDESTVPAWVEVDGRRLALWRSVDACGRPALVIGGVNHRTRWSVEKWARGAAAVFGVGVGITRDIDEGPTTESRSRSRSGSADADLDSGAGSGGGHGDVACGAKSGGADAADGLTRPDAAAWSVR